MTYQFYIKDYTNMATYDLLELQLKLGWQLAISGNDIQAMRMYRLISDEIETRIKENRSSSIEV